MECHRCNPPLDLRPFLLSTYTHTAARSSVNSPVDRFVCFSILLSLPIVEYSKTSPPNFDIKARAKETPHRTNPFLKLGTKDRVPPIQLLSTTPPACLGVGGSFGLRESLRWPTSLAFVEKVLLYTTQSSRYCCVLGWWPKFQVMSVPHIPYPGVLNHALTVV